MIDIKEMRIGNIVYDKALKNQIKWFPYNFAEHFRIDSYHSTKYVENFEYVLITHEQLLKFGFVANTDLEGFIHSYQKRGDNYHFEIVPAHQDCPNYYITFGELDSVEVKYNHELQNLFYFITKQEL